MFSIMHPSGWCCPDLDIHQSNGTDCSDHWIADLPFPSQYDFAAAQLVADDNPLLEE
jgi:hypothetical protein